MKRLLTLLLFAALVTDTAFAADGLFNRKKERKRKRKTEQVEAVKVPADEKKPIVEPVTVQVPSTLTADTV